MTLITSIHPTSLVTAVRNGWEIKVFKVFKRYLRQLDMRLKSQTNSKKTKSWRECKFGAVRMPESGTQLIADLLYVAPQLAMHNLVTYQVDRRDGVRGHAGWCISHSFFAFGNVGNVVRKTWTYLVRTCHTTNDVVCHHVANRFVPFRLSGGTCHLSSGCSTVTPQGAGARRAP